MFLVADVACYHSLHPSGRDRNKVCYDAGKQALDATPRPSYAMLTAVSLPPPLGSAIGSFRAPARSLD
jgi:hypothetical protein